MNDQNEEASARRRQGMAVHYELFGQAGRERMASLGDLGEMIFDFAYGEVWARPGLPLRERSLLTVGMLAVLARTEELRTHMRGALAAGATPDQLKEVVLHSAVYGGFPVAVNAMRVLNEVLAEGASG